METGLSARSDLLSGRLARLGLPIEIIKQLLDNGASEKEILDCSSDEGLLMRTFQNARGYAFDWGWIIERNEMIATEDGDQPRVEFGIVPLRLFEKEMDIENVSNSWINILGSMGDDLRVPFWIEEGNAYEALSIVTQGFCALEETRKWIAECLVTITVPALIEWSESDDRRPEQALEWIERMRLINAVDMLKEPH